MFFENGLELGEDLIGAKRRQLKMCEGHSHEARCSGRFAASAGDKSQALTSAVTMTGAGAKSADLFSTHRGIIYDHLFQ